MLKAILTAVVLFAGACAAEVGGDEDVNTVDVGVSVEAVTACELSSAQKARNAWIARYPNAFPACTQWSYNNTTHVNTAFFGNCPTFPQLTQSEAIYGNNYAPPQGWRWFGTIGAGHIYQCVCAETGGGVSCSWIS